MPGFTDVPTSAGADDATNPWRPCFDRDLRRPARRWCRMTWVQCEAPSTRKPASLRSSQPARAVGSELQHRSRVARRLGVSSARRSATGSCFELRRQLVDESLREEGVVRMADRTPEPHRHAGVGEDMLDALIRKTVGLVEQAFGSGLVRQFHRPCELRQSTLHPARRDRVAGRPDMQRNRHAGAVDRRSQARHLHGAIEVVPHVLFAGPYQLHSDTRHVHRDAHGPGDIVRLSSRRPKPPPSRVTWSATSPSATGTRAAARWRAAHLRHLGRRPDLDLVRRATSRAVAFIGSSAACADRARCRTARTTSRHPSGLVDVARGVEHEATARLAA